MKAHIGTDTQGRGHSVKVMTPANVHDAVMNAAVPAQSRRGDLRRQGFCKQIAKTGGTGEGSRMACVAAGLPRSTGCRRRAYMCRPPKTFRECHNWA